MRIDVNPSYRRLHVRCCRVLCSGALGLATGVTLALAGRPWDAIRAGCVATWIVAEMPSCVLYSHRERT